MRRASWSLRVSDCPQMYIPAVSAMVVVMTDVTVSEARARLAEVVDGARVTHEPVFLTRRGKRVAAIVAADDLDALIEAAEDLADLRAAGAARDEMRRTGEMAIPWEDVKADLGLS